MGEPEPELESLGGEEREKEEEELAAETREFAGAPCTRPISSFSLNFIQNHWKYVVWLVFIVW